MEQYIDSNLVRLSFSANNELCYFNWELSPEEDYLKVAFKAGSGNGENTWDGGFNLNDKRDTIWNFSCTYTTPCSKGEISNNNKNTFLKVLFHEQPLEISNIKACR